MYRAFSENGLERNSVVIALGGGVVGDTAGFAAATYLRGVPFVQIPTTLLAMADSSIGGKVGVDTPFGKNLVGAFKQPGLVIMSKDCLASLPEDELRCGYAEIIKGALLAGGPDYALVRRLAHRERTADDVTAIDGTLHQALVNKIQLKRAVVEEDPFEQGRRALLNLGHTFGHGIEAWSGLRIKHGFAVALGMTCALRASHAVGLCTAGFVDESLAILRGAGLPTSMSDMAHTGTPVLDAPAIWRVMQSDKKKRAGHLRFVLIRAPGDAFVSDAVGESLAIDILNMLAK
jgi:3-dehydroquinate synthase